ncbi:MULTISPECIES: hypothetical protein [Gordonia]|uniref:NADH-ubiquinone oxidoreductase n=2 Tax=Gordonia TaxID=2053 RepID=L7LPC2_9ACTN|nr:MULTISPECIES: hypothetical protein [Gordonia]AUH67820.1 hypothetical protein CXX93_05040 [Gordonia sp. YC-JH1]KJR06130.1 hypothetical protein UG54_14570 [Gordonia sihwensis]KXT58261.1 hypothetical protein Y710_04085 [Gordonia sp. QH-12]MBY4570839.1 hypothetical protein [Gordonia sihwensis]WFN92488.1 hypothetical protein P5P27_17220 [Gordonia sihwensis]
MTNRNATTALTSRILTPSVVHQCIGFMIGSALFAIGSAPGFGNWAGASVVNICYFAGSWFFTGAAFIQLVLSGSPTVPVSYAPGVMVRAEWFAAATQFFGTLLFNVSTGGALMTHTIRGEKHLVWTPDAAGSVAFLVSGFFVLVAFSHATGRMWAPGDRNWWSGQINFIGCVAFGVSAVASYITVGGITVDAVAANVGTFVGAICFFLASAVVLPRASAAR